MLQSLSVFMIKFYRKHLSKRKGFKCAYGVKYQRNTCSGIGLKAFQKAGFFKGLKLLRRQLDRCTVAHFELNQDSKLGTYKRLSYHHSSQRGFVDCGSGSDCDCGSGCGCDVGHCPIDCPSCDLDCNKCSPTDLCDFIDVCDLIPETSGGDKKEKAENRLAEIDLARQERRASDVEDA